MTQPKVYIHAMRNLIALILLSGAGLAAQSIRNVDYEVLPGNLIEVTYTIQDGASGGVYGIELFASLDGGYSYPIRAESITGDVGRRVRGAGRKAIIWKVLDDLPALASDNLVLKVVARPRATISGFFVSLIAGNRLTKRLSNGVTFYGGGGKYSDLGGGSFGDMLDDGTLLPTLNGRFGLRITKVPFVYRFEGHYRKWDLHVSEVKQMRLRRLAYALDSYNGQDILLHYAGFSFALAYTPLPVFGIFLPQVGGGFNLSQFQLGSSIGEPLSTMNNSGLFAEVGVQVNLLRWIKVNGGVRQDFLNPLVGFREFFLEVGFHIPTR